MARHRVNRPSHGGFRIAESGPVAAQMRDVDRDGRPAGA
jgi:hypothetical protein